LRKQWQEIAVCLAIVAVSALVYFESLKLPPGNYDPLGGGTMPRIVCSIIIVLCLAAVAQIVVPALMKASPAGSAPAPGHQERPLLASFLFVLLVVYTLSIQLRVPFALSTIVFLFVSTMALARFRKSVVPLALLISVGAGLSLNYVFTSIFKVDLP
jgi:hypothetical protein